MKLTNPTDGELNACFAEVVCGWMWREERGGAWFLKSADPDPMTWVRITDSEGADIALRPHKMEFTRYADRVLPYLEKHRDEGRRVGCEMGCRRWKIWIHDKGPDGLYPSSLEKEPDGDADTFPRAVVIALLRANGVTVEFAP